MLSILYYFFLTLFIVFILKRLSSRRRILLSKEIPCIGGVAFFLVFLLMIVLSSGFSGKSVFNNVFVISGLVVLFVTGVMDDLFEFSIRQKFLSQISASLLLIAGGIHTDIVYIGNFANALISLIWIIGITNAFNHLDVIDGLAAGVGLTVSLAFFILSILSQDFAYAYVSIVLVSMLSAFLLYNIPPAKVYLGNSGSHFLGMLIACLAITIRYAPLDKPIALLSPIVITWFAIFDTFFLICIRIFKGQSAFNKSNDHLAMRFLKARFSKQDALLVMLGLSMTFSALGVLISKAHTIVGYLCIGTVILISVTVGFVMAKVNIDA